MFSGNEGNTFYVESGLDMHLKWRLSLQGGLMYVFPTKFSDYDLGGLGFRLRAGDELVRIDGKTFDTGVPDRGRRLHADAAGARRRARAARAAARVAVHGGRRAAAHAATSSG